MNRYPKIDEIAAAWAFCGMLALGAFFGGIGDVRDDPSLTVYGGVHLPSAGEARVLDREPDEGESDGHRQIAELRSTGGDGHGQIPYRRAQLALTAHAGPCSDRSVAVNGLSSL